MEFEKKKRNRTIHVKLLSKCNVKYIVKIEKETPPNEIKQIDANNNTHQMCIEYREKPKRKAKMSKI